MKYVRDSMELKVGGLVTISGKEYIVESFQLARRVFQKFSTETVTISLLGCDDAAEVEIVFVTSTRGGDV